MEREQDKWWERPPSTCPICGKKFVPAPEHYWKINVRYYRKDKDYEYDMTHGEYRNTNVCSYTCMRKWEKERFAKTDKVGNSGGKSRQQYNEKQLAIIMERIHDPLNKEIARLYYAERYKIDAICEKLGFSSTDAQNIRGRINYIHSIIRNISGLLEEE